MYDKAHRRGKRSEVGNLKSAMLRHFTEAATQIPRGLHF